MPGLWPQTPFADYFDQVLFSCSVGFRKPDARFYGLACRKLSVQAERCFYVGDIGDELFGAEEVGMEAVLMCPADEEDIIMAREATRRWTGPRITSLSQVLDYVE